MHCLVGVFCLLAPALASAFSPASPPVIHEDGGPVDKALATDKSFDTITLQLPNDYGLPNDGVKPIWKFQVKVLNSTEPCGYGNITINGQTLEQTPNGKVMTGKGNFQTPLMGVAPASWTFNCIELAGGHQYQRLSFVVHSLDGKAVRGIGINAIFTQTAPAEIHAISNASMRPKFTTTRPDPEDRHRSAAYPPSHKEVKEHKIAELHRMRAHLRELQLLIVKKEQALAEHICRNSDGNCNHGGFKKSIWATATGKVRKVTHNLFGEAGGSQQDRFPQPPSWHPHPPKNTFHWRGAGSLTYGPPEHGEDKHPKLPPLSTPWKSAFRKPYDRRPQSVPHAIKDSPQHPPQSGLVPPHGLPDHDRNHDESRLEPPPVRLFSSESNDRPRPVHWHKPGHTSPTPDSDHKQTPRKGFGFWDPIKVAKVAVFIYLLACVLAVLQRRKYLRNMREASQSHIEQLESHTSMKLMLCRLQARLSGRTSNITSDEKREALVTDMESAMMEEITQLRNAANVVGDIVTKEDERSQVRDKAEMPAYEYSEACKNSAIA
ncbi:uncharacterized protein BP5553_08146 [Venustampulla echinocandica]|uniref:Uncharacterized protein n=1 Tax=Venustampulla echinocandica TaxID=2656787 RepID=A0A370TFV3_9HELO|nr:uncharacterized protein BP5553_08146 [Venustampulla echinocandica]RDL33778.1 hypothetical protein BP5553_08146 [Venustampulla echinocandica]